jgi:hypothetical protein
MVNRTMLQVGVSGLRLLRVALLIAFPVSVAWLWATWPKPPVLVSEAAATPVAEAAMPAAHALAWYAPLWERDLKQSPIPPVLEPQKATPVESVPLPILLATLVEPHGRYAHFQSRSGKPEMKGLHETIDRFRIQAIEPGRVQLQDHDALVWVAIPKTKEPK